MREPHRHTRAMQRGIERSSLPTRAKLRYLWMAWVHWSGTTRGWGSGRAGCHLWLSKEML